jgi:hypothetical protein
MLVHLHIGLDKTGSTAIQHHMVQNRQWYAERGIFIPRTGLSHVGHHVLFNRLFPDKLDEFHQELKGATSLGFDTFFLSWEGMHTLSAERLEKVKQLFPGHQFRIHVFLREQTEILQSGVLQNIKRGNNNRTLEEAKNNLDFLSHPKRDYKKLLEKFSRVFGKDSIAAHVYDKTLLPDGNVVKGLLASMDLKEDEDFVFSKQASNISLDVPSARVLDEIDQNQQLTQPQRKAIVDQLLNDIAKNGSLEKYFLSPQEVAFMRQHFLRSNRKVVKTWLGPDWPYADLFPYKKETSTALDEEAIDAAVRDKQQKLTTLQRYYTWKGDSLTGAQLARLAQPENGWNTADKSGVSPTSELCHIHFRPFWEALERQQTSLRLVLKCSLSPDHPAPRISVNGKDKGELQAGRNAIKIPFDTMNSFYCVDIDISCPQQIGAAGQKGFKIRAAHYKLLTD